MTLLLLLLLLLLVGAFARGCCGAVLVRLWQQAQVPQHEQQVRPVLLAEAGQGVVKGTCGGGSSRIRAGASGVGSRRSSGIRAGASGVGSRRSSRIRAGATHWSCASLSLRTDMPLYLLTECDQATAAAGTTAVHQCAQAHAPRTSPHLKLTQEAQHLRPQGTFDVLTYEIMLTNLQGDFKRSFLAVSRLGSALLTSANM